MLGKMLAALGAAALLTAGTAGAAETGPAFTHHEQWTYEDYYNFENPCVPGDVVYGTGTRRSNMQWTQRDSDYHVAITDQTYGRAVGSTSGLEYVVKGNFSGSYEGDFSSDYVSTLVGHSVFTAPGPDNNLTARYQIRFHLDEGVIKTNYYLYEVVCTGG